jgi:hypothetical protein
MVPKWLPYVAIGGNVLFLLWVFYNGMNEGFRATLPQFASYVGVMGLRTERALVHRVDGLVDAGLELEERRRKVVRSHDVELSSSAERIARHAVAARHEFGSERARERWRAGRSLRQCTQVRLALSAGLTPTPVACSVAAVDRRAR